MFMPNQYLTTPSSPTEGNPGIMSDLVIDINEINQTQQLVNKFDTSDIHFENMKEMSIDFVSSKNLMITGLKEFLEIFLSSISKNMTFHFEIISGLYQYVGVELDYNDEPLNQRLKKL